VRLWLIGFVSVMCLLGFSPGFATAVSAPVAQGLNLISVNDEIELGRQTQAQVRSETPSVNDSAVSGYLSGVFGQLARRATGPRYPYSVSIANYAEVNAFSLPGGPVWIHRGSIEAAQNESQLAGVLAHEIGHIERRHVAQQISKQMVTGGLLALLGRVLPNDRAGKIGEIAAGLTAQTVMLKFSRSDESEADREGTRMLQAAGWDARGLADFLQVLRSKEGGDPSSVGVFLSNHPAPGERAAALRAAGLRAGGKRDSAEFQRVRSRLNQMPPAPRMKR
jgi:predicted Zn-dependent protease